MDMFKLLTDTSIDDIDREIERVMTIMRMNEESRLERLKRLQWFRLAKGE